MLKKILEKEKIKYTNLFKATSGFTNLVYFVDNDYVVKFSNDEKLKHKLEKEISIYQNLHFKFMPKLIASGEVEGYTYLIISKLQGKSLFSIWHTLNETERNDIVDKISSILKQFNMQDGNFLEENYKFNNWSKYMREQLEEKSKKLRDLGINTDILDNFILNRVDTLFNQNTFGLVYNDAHFDNFIYNKGELSLIDFDRVLYCPIDYEMLIFKTMCDNPAKFASEEDEINVKLEDYTGVYSRFKVKYPEMFADSRTEKRIFIYQFNYLIKQAIDCNNLKWIASLLTEFNKNVILF